MSTTTEKEGIYEATLTLTGKTGRVRKVVATHSLYTECSTLYPSGSIDLALKDENQETSFSITANVTADEVQTQFAHIGLYKVPESGTISPSTDVVASWKAYRGDEPNATNWYEGAWTPATPEESSTNPEFPIVGGPAADFTIDTMSPYTELVDGVDYVA